METVIITGGSGLIGSELTRLLVEKDYRIIILTRRKNEVAAAAHISYSYWDPAKKIIDAQLLANTDHIVHLAGANVGAKRWTASRKKEIAESRTQSAALLYETLSEKENKIRTVISASAIGYYDIRQNKIFTEEDIPATDFLGKTCQQWEKSVLKMETLGKRVVINRLGIVLSTRGGMLPAYLMPLRFGIAGIMGNGEQWTSWVHIQDVCRVFAAELSNNMMHGIYNVVAPNPVKQKELIILLAQKLKGRNYISLPIPAFMLRILLGEMSIEILKSCRVSAEKMLETGYQFLYQKIDMALEDLVKEEI